MAIVETGSLPPAKGVMDWLGGEVAATGVGGDKTLFVLCGIDIYRLCWTAH